MTGSAARRAGTIGRRAAIEPPKSVDRSTSVGWPAAATPLSLGVVAPVRVLLGKLVVPDEDEAPSARRSRRDWIVDCMLFLLAVALGAASLADQIHIGLHGPLLFFDVAGGAALCLGLWGRRRWPFGLGLASVPILAFSSFAWMAGGIILFTVAAYRRWQLALLLAGLQLAVLPVNRAVQPEADSLPTLAFYVICALTLAAIVAWGMFVRGRRQAQRERQRHAETEQALRVEQIVTRSAPASHGRCTTFSPTGSRC
jgi:hypothetical protein